MSAENYTGPGMPFELMPPKIREHLIAVMTKQDALAGQLMAMAAQQTEVRRTRLLSSLAIIIAGGTLEVFQKAAAVAFLLALTQATPPPGLEEFKCDCPVCRAKREQHGPAEPPAPGKDSFAA